MSIFWINSILIIVTIFMESQVTSVSLIKWEAVFDPTFGCIWMLCSAHNHWSRAGSKQGESNLMQGPEDIFLASNSTLHHGSGTRRCDHSRLHLACKRAIQDCITSSETQDAMRRAFQDCRDIEHPLFLEILLQVSTPCRRNTRPCLLRLDMDSLLLPLLTSILTSSSPTIFSVNPCLPIYI